MGAGAGSGPGGSPSFLLMWIHSLQKDIKEENYIKKKKDSVVVRCDNGVYSHVGNVLVLFSRGVKS